MYASLLYWLSTNDGSFVLQVYSDTALFEPSIREATIKSLRALSCPQRHIQPCIIDYLRNPRMKTSLDDLSEMLQTHPSPVLVDVGAIGTSYKK